MSKPLTSDKNSKSLKIKKQIINIFKRKIKRSNIIIVIGGRIYAANIKKIKNPKNYFMELILVIMVF